MGIGYTRNDTSNNIANGNVIDAADLDGEFDAIQAAFAAATGHTHDGTSAEGGAVTVLGPAQDLVASATAVYPKTDSAYTLGSSTNAWSTAYIDALNLGGTAITSTAAELNYVDGVTSSIQTQLDAKLPKSGGTMTGDVGHGDNVKATFGASADLEIYHDGSNSWLRNVGTGSLYVAGDADGDVIIQGKAGQNSVACFDDGAVQLYHSGSEKLATTSNGINVTGNVVVSGTVDGRDVATDGTKLDGIAAGAQVNVATNLGATANGTSLTVSSSTGTNASIPAATTSAWGAMTDEDKTKLDGIAASANNYSHPTHPGDDFSVDTGALTGATVVSDIDINVTTDTLGHVTDANGTVNTRTLTLADLGYTGATNANYITNNNQLTNGAGYTTYTANQSLDTSNSPTFDVMTLNGNLTVNANDNSSDIYMHDGDETTRRIHCNSNRIGFLTSAGNWGTYSDNSGNWTASGNVTAYSDERLKEDVQVIDNALEKVDALRGVTYTRNDLEDTTTRHAGVIAQEVQKVLPEVVVEDQKGILNVAYGNMVGLLIEAVKELKAEVEELKKGK